MNRKILMAVAAVLAVGAVSIKANALPDSGCGLGSMLIPSNVAWKQVFAATTNGTFGNQTFGISTGTLGCESGGLGKSAMARQNFVAANYRDLSREMAAGGGEYVASLSSLMGCSNPATFAKFTQSKYQTLFPSADTQPAKMLQTLQSEMSKDATMSASCSI
jgi:hypothetical protein